MKRIIGYAVFTVVFILGAATLTSTFCYKLETKPHQDSTPSVQQIIEDGNLPFITPRQIQQGLIARKYLDPCDPNAMDGKPGQITLTAWKKCNNNDYAKQVNNSKF